MTLHTGDSMTIKAKDLVQVVPLYYEFIDPNKGKRGSRKFWEIVPSEWNKHGSVTSFLTAWGRIGSVGSSKERPGQTVWFCDLDKLIETKTRKGYVRRPRPEYRSTVQIDGLEPGNIGIVLSVKESWNRWRNVAEILMGGVIVRFPTRFLTVIKVAADEEST